MKRCGEGDGSDGKEGKEASEERAAFESSEQLDSTARHAGGTKLAKLATPRRRLPTTQGQSYAGVFKVRIDWRGLSSRGARPRNEAMKEKARLVTSRNKGGGRRNEGA